MKGLGFRQLITIGLGIIIGSGVITLTGFAIGLTGTGASLAYIVAGIVFLVSMLPTLIVGVTIPRTSFSYTVSKELLSPKMGGLFLIIFFYGRIIMAFFGIAFANYVLSLAPSAPFYVIAVGIITLFYVVNLFGVGNATKVQTIFNFILLFSLLSFVVLGLFKLEPDALSTSRMFIGGLDGFVKAVALLMFSMSGGLILLEFGGAVKDPSRTLFRAAITVTFIAMILFALVALVGGGVLPQESVAGKPLTGVAEVVYGNRVGLYVFVIGGALMALVTTINASLMWYSATMIKGVEDGWFPKVIARKNKYDSPYILLTVFWLMGILPIILKVDTMLLVQVGTGIALLFFFIPNLALINLPKKYPDEWKNSRFYIKSQVLVNILTIGCSTLFLALIVYNFKGYGMNVIYTVAVLIVLGIIYVCIRERMMLNDDKS